MKVIDYITEEVRRQGHDVTKVDGLERVGWMIEAWVCAVLEFPRSFPNADAMVRSITRLGRRIESGNIGIRTCNVRVGMNHCPDWQEVPRLLEQLCANQAAFSPIEFYKEFEMIHPFVDGNGRTGKILLNWKNRTLLDPVFPPSDLFGTPISNP